MSSPPFLEAKAGAGISRRGYGEDGKDKVGERTYSNATVGKTTGQIGNLPNPNGDIDAALSSPPYDREEHNRWRKNKAWPIHQNAAAGGESYGDSNGQIGNIKGETYCAAMLQVYRQFHQVLKPEGVVCLVTKNPVKKGKIRRLDLDTIRLMEAAGFTLLERQQAMLVENLGTQHRFQGESVVIRRERKSFFKRLFERKHPDLRVDHEDVLWFQKNEEAGG